MTTKRNNKEIRWGYFFLIRRLLQASALLTLLLSTATLQAQVKVLEVRDLKFLPGGDRSEAYDVNNLGQVLGWSNAEFGLCTSGAGGSPQPCRHQGPFLWTEAGGMQQYFVSKHANAINDFGQVMWSYFYDGNNYTYFEGPDMPEPLELVNSEDVSMNGVDINNRGQVVGDGTRYNPDTGDDYHFLFVWSMEGEDKSSPCYLEQAIGTGERLALTTLARP